jgi:hypothetical protein
MPSVFYFLDFSFSFNNFFSSHNMVVSVRAAFASALLASATIASPAVSDAKTNKLSKKDVDTRYPYNGPTVVIAE